jgi:hypothetical protein
MDVARRGHDTGAPMARSNQLLDLKRHAAKKGIFPKIRRAVVTRDLRR